MKNKETIRQLYNLMFRKGWYTVEKAETNKVNQKFQTLNQEYNTLI